MGYYLRTAVGLALFLGSIAVFDIELIQLLEVGTCASGNTPYEIARPCPAGTGTAILLLIASVFSGLIGAAIFAFRGRPPGGGGRSIPWGSLAFGLFFAVTGAVALIAALTSEAIGPDGELGGKIVGVTFLVMGVGSLLFSLWWSGALDRS